MRLKTIIHASIAVFTAAFTVNAQNTTIIEDVTSNLRPRHIVGTDIPRYSLQERMEHYGVPGVAVGIIKDGKLVFSGGFGVLQDGDTAPVDADTLFSAGSVSKVATAILILKMHTEGLIDIDADVRSYLKTWDMPAFELLEDTKITLRMILSHTAGFNIHGFRDFEPDEALPTVYDTLNGTNAAADGEALALLFQPGTRYKYSGGGYTLAQLIASDTVGQSFADTSQKNLFVPLGMQRSTFENPLPANTTNIAKAHDRNGKPVALPRGYQSMPEMAASGLWTSANDLSTLVINLIESYRKTDGFLPHTLAQDMMTKVSPSEHGLGPRMEGRGSARLFHHAGSNDSYKTWIEGHLVTGDGLVVLTNGTRGNDLFVEIRNAVADTFGWEINKPVMLPAINVSQSMLKSYQGTYRVNTNFPFEKREQLIGWIYDRPVTIHRAENSLQFSIGDSERKHTLIPTAPNRFLVPILAPRIGVAEMIFHRGADGLTNSLSLTYPGAQSHYQRIEK